MHFSYLRDYVKISSIINGLISTSVAMFTNNLLISLLYLVIRLVRIALSS